jgi:threonine/homoserine/homoserine lactone efflux protein
MEGLTSFILAGIALTGSPGPATLGLAACAASLGVRGSLRLLAGTIIGVIAVMLLTASGLTGLLFASPTLGRAVSALAVGYMLYLAYRIATAPPPGERGANERPLGFIAGLFLGLGNPKAYAAMASLFSGFTLVREARMADLEAKIIILVAIILVVDLIWLLLGSAMSRALHKPGLGRAINIGFAVFLVASVLLAAAL